MIETEFVLFSRRTYPTLDWYGSGTSESWLSCSAERLEAPGSARSTSSASGPALDRQPASAHVGRTIGSLKAPNLKIPD